MAVTLLVVEIELSEVLVIAAVVVVIETVNWEAVNANTQVVVALVGFLRRGEEAAFFPHVIHEAHRTRVVG